MPFVFPPLNAFQARHLALLDIQPEILVEPLYLVKHLIFTSCMGELIHRTNRNVRSVASLQKGKPFTSSQERHVYVSRRINPKRPFVSEEALENMLTSEGFEVVYPEMLSVDQQIELFSTADIVVSSTGAAFSNVIYCKPGALVVEVQPRRMENTWVRNLSAMCGLRWAPYFCDADVADEANPESGMSFDYDIFDFVEFIHRAKGM
jgi:capsular polysaccharide biosynthesis protein